jgi:fructosamine-3-kinase
VRLADLRARPEQLVTLLHHQRIRETPVSGGSICHARRLTLDDGASVFVKTLHDPTYELETAAVPPGFFEAEAHGLEWLREAGGARVPEVIAVTPQMLVLEWIEPRQPTAAAARHFGAQLAATHRAGATAFGAPWPGYIGSLPQGNESGPSWPRWFAERRLEPYLRTAADKAALQPQDQALVAQVMSRIEELAPPQEPPSRLHGDLWPANLLWGADGHVWLIDPAAHGGHRETDLAQLALFGAAPFLAEILAGYAEVWPLADGWPARVGLHQLHLLLVHAALFGGAYRDPVCAAARAALQGR